MEFEQAIILSLSEPLKYDDLFKRARKLRKKAKRTISRQTFNKTLKILVSDGFVKKNLKKEGKVIYELEDSDKGKAVRTYFKEYVKHEDEIIMSVSEYLGKIAYEVIEKNKNKNKIEISSEEEEKYKTIVFYALLLLLEYQKYYFFLKKTPGNVCSINSAIGKKIKHIETVFSLVLNPIANILGEESFNAIYESVLRSMNLNIKINEEAFKIVQKYYQEKT